MSGFLLVDKPLGITSHKALQIIRNKFSLSKIGHSGTLDPFATGLLVVGVGEALKYISYIEDEPKVYRATLKLGSKTDTGDLSGKVTETRPVPLWKEKVEDIFQKMKGAQTQIPPMYSAKKVDGQKLYKIARKGLSVERKPEPITIHHLELVSMEEESLVFEAGVSRGTYIRTLAEKMAEEMGTVGHLTALHRTKAGAHDVERAKKPDELNLPQDYLPVSSFLTHLQTIELDEKEAADILCGKQVLKDAGENHHKICALFCKNSFLGLGSYDQGLITAKRMMSSIYAS